MSEKWNEEISLVNKCKWKKKEEKTFDEILKKKICYIYCLYIKDHREHFLEIKIWLKSLRTKYFGAVSQEPTLFNGTIE